VTDFDGALWYSNRRVPILAVDAGTGERPLTRHGFKDATTDERQRWASRYQPENRDPPPSRIASPDWPCPAATACADAEGT